jgi:AraC family transcriptional activator of tynA and feaB
MANIQSISTENLPPQRRAAFWNEAVCETFTQLEARPYDPPQFNASLQRIDLGELTLARALSRPSLLRHSETRARRAEEQVFLLHLQANGDSINVQDGREAVLRTGDFTLCNSARPYALRFDSLNDMLVLRIPATCLESRVARPADFTAVCIPGDRGVGLLVSQLVRTWWSSCVAGLDRGLSERVATSVLDLLATALCAEQSTRVCAETMGNAKRLRIQHYVESHLADAELGAHAIAAAVGVTPRYVHRLFEETGETLGQRILRRRLECCAQRLRDPALQGLSITQIAFDLAFTDSSYFGRCFKRQFGTTPGDYRRQMD